MAHFRKMEIRIEDSSSRLNVLKTRPMKNLFLVAQAKRTQKSAESSAVIRKTASHTTILLPRSMEVVASLFRFC